jgi:OOP family OmpA-OmpF porin
MSWKIRAAAALALGSVAATASAEQRAGDWYLVPQAGYTWLDNDRNAKDDMFLGLAVGKHLNDAWSLELGITTGEFDLPGNTSSELDITTYSLDVLRVFARNSVVSPYISLGAGALHSKYTGQSSDTNFLAQAGLGLMIQLAEKQDGTMRFSLRPEIKARWDLPRHNDPQDKFLDYSAGLGFQFAFGPAPVVVAPEPEPAPPPPPPAPPPAPKDSDGDGVLDPNDRCPDTPRGVAVDEHGCPRRGSVTLHGVTFEFDSATLTSESRPALAAVATDVKRYPNLKLELQGHTDSVGNDAYNLRLSEQRAQSVREFLIAEGVSPQQLTAKGYGETQPTADNSTAEGRAENRRVDMQVLDNPGDVQVKGDVKDE